MYRAIKLNKFTDADILLCYQFYRKNLQCTANFTQKHKKFGTLQIFEKSFQLYLQRISFLAIKIECKMNSKSE